MKYLIRMMLLLVMATPAYAQERPEPVTFPVTGNVVELYTLSGVVLQVLTPNLNALEPFHVQGNHAGLNTASYSLILDGVVVETKPVTALVAGVIDFFRPAGTTAGVHTAMIRATGTGTPPLTADSVVLSFTVNVPTIAVPNVVGMTQAAATAAIIGGKFVLGTVTTAPSATVPLGTVISQTPVAGALAAPGSAINIVVSSGPVAAPLAPTGIRIIR